MKILFQGDSITDAVRNREDVTSLGEGYAFLAAAELSFAATEVHTFINKGISGNRIVDLYARMKADIINLQPDVLSILIGVNDVWHDLLESPNGVDAEKFYRVYTMMIHEIKQNLPTTKLMIMEPFVLPGTATFDHWDYFDSEVKKRAEVSRRVAEENQVMFVPLQEGFNKLAQESSNEYLLKDGVHPTAAGHAYIRNQWLKAFQGL